MAGKNLSERFGCVTRLHLLGSARFTLAVAAPVTAQEGTSPWDRYLPGRLQAVIEIGTPNA
jgi:hypothetical protein